jgi:hypothetical protein
MIELEMDAQFERAVTMFARTVEEGWVRALATRIEYGS